MKKFNADKARDLLVEWIRNKINGFGADSKCVIGISGGKDSSVVAALCVRALGKDRVYGVMMPNGAQPDIKDSMQLIKTLGIHRYLINISDICYQLKEVVETAVGEASESAMINMPARVRMTTLYMVAQTLGNAFVVNTGNLSERFVGYFTWHGDGAGDFAPLAEFTSDEVMEIGDACGLPHNLTHKIPADGLSGKTDEEKLGFTYEELNKYIRTGEIDDLKVKEKIDYLHKINNFKILPLDTYNSDLPIMIK